MRYKITVTEYDDVVHNRDAVITRVDHHLGDPIEALHIAVAYDNRPPRFETAIQREPEKTDLPFSELIEAARGCATTGPARAAWLQAMITLIDGWVYPHDDIAPIAPPPERYWHHAGSEWARLVHIPPPHDLVDALAADPARYGGHWDFVATARTAIGGEPPSRISTASPAAVLTDTRLSSTGASRNPPAHRPIRRRTHRSTGLHTA